MAASNKAKKKGGITEKRVVKNNHALDGIAPGDNPEDVWNRNRKAVKVSICRVLQDYITKQMEKDKKEHLPHDQAETLSSEYEKFLYDRFKSNIVKYQEQFRKNLIALKSQKTEFSRAIALGQISIEDFVRLKPEELMSAEQKIRNDKLKERELKASIGESLPDNIAKIKEQNQYAFVSEKWGLSGSSAAIDDDDD